jgi:molybdopterin adenylyltransferase
VSDQVPSGARALVLTISDGVAAGTRQDTSGIALGDRLSMLGFRVDRRSIADERPLIEAALREGAQDHVFVISTGGTGLTPRDVTPQATLAVIDYEVPGLAEAMRAAGRASTPMADLSRGVVGVIGRTLVVNVPGSASAATESLAALEPTLAHALVTLAGPYDHEAESTPGATAGDAAPAAMTAGDTPASHVAASHVAAAFDADGADAALQGDALLGIPAIPPGDPADPWRDLPHGASESGRE